MKTDYQIAREQGVSRQAIHQRRKMGWTDEEILSGERSAANSGRYRTRTLASLGRTVPEIADELSVSKYTVWRWIREGRMRGMAPADAIAKAMNMGRRNGS